MEFLSNMLGSSSVEIVATIFGLINITLIIRRSVWNYPFGLVMVTLYFFIFKEAKLYSNMLLQLYFVGMQIFGWYWWLKRTDDDGLVVVERIGLKPFVFWLSVGAFLIILLGKLMSVYTDGSDTYWDATISVGSVLAMYFMARRWLETWVMWILVDIIAIGLYWKQGLEPTAALYTVFLIMASIGLYQWKQSWNNQDNQLVESAPS